MIRNGVLVGAVMAVIAIIGSAIGTSPYPVAGTTFFVLAAAFETVALFVVLRPRSYQHSWGRALVAALLCLVTLWFSAQDTVGAPEYVFMHQRWLVAATLGCLVLAISSAVVRVRRRHAA
jgi:hypothetical protein